MEANLVGLTKPSAYTGCNTAEELVAYCARVSNPKNQDKHNTGPKLIRSLLRDGHWSPLEMVSINIEIKTTRDIARQILRHRSFSFQEFSQRYAKVAGLVEPRETRLQDKKNRQNSLETNDASLKEEWRMRQLKLARDIEENYEWAINVGIAKEQARAILPEGLAPSVLYMHGTLRSWVHYCLLRMAWDTQKEHREVAEKCWEIIKQHFPQVVTACEYKEQYHLNEQEVFDFGNGT